MGNNRNRRPGSSCCLVPAKIPDHPPLGRELWSAIYGAGPILVGVWSKKAHKKAAWVAAVGGLLGYLYLYMGGITKSVYLAGAQGCTISVVLMLIATYMLKPYPDEDYSGYFPEKVKQA